MARPSARRSRALAVGALLAGLVLAGLPLRSADAVGDANPVITSPTGARPLYAETPRPYVVDFGNAPTGGYTFRVERLPSGQAPEVVEVGTFTWTGSGPSSRSFSLAPLTAYPQYRFVVEDDATREHGATVTFEVRAGAQPRCAVVTQTKLRVNAGEEFVPGRLHSGCAAAHVQYASWDVKNLSRGTYVNSLAFGTNTTDSWTYFDGQPLGVYAVKPVTALNAAGDDIAQNFPRTDVRLDSRFSLSSSRSGSTVTLAVSLRKYKPSANTFGPWGKHAIAFSYRTCSSCPWTHFHTQKTTNGGKAVYRFRASSVREYRVTSGGTWNIWAPYPHYEKR